MFSASLDNIFTVYFCCCWSVNKDVACHHCQNHHCKLLYYKGLFKAPKDVPKELKNDKYLLRALKADPFYSYFKEENRILMSIDSPEWIDFFINKEKM